MNRLVAHNFTETCQYTFYYTTFLPPNSRFLPRFDPISPAPKEVSLKVSSQPHPFWCEVQLSFRHDPLMGGVSSKHLKTPKQVSCGKDHRERLSSTNCLKHTTANTDQSTIDNSQHSSMSRQSVASDACYLTTSASTHHAACTRYAAAIRQSCMHTVLCTHL